MKLPDSIRCASVISVEKEKILVIGGESRTGALKSFVDIDLVKEHLAPLPNLENPITNACSYYFNSNLYIMFGDNGEGNQVFFRS